MPRPGAPLPLKQSTLLSLGGVVSLEQIAASKAVLDARGGGREQVEQQLKHLRRLATKSPSTDVLISTGIGKTLRRLAKDKDKDKDKPVDSRVREEAVHLYSRWRREVERREELKARGPREVSYDEDTNDARKRSRRVLREALGKERGQKTRHLATELELSTFLNAGKLLNSKYRKEIRTLALKLQHRPQFRKELIDKA